jgi:hypothetical protein
MSSNSQRRQQHLHRRAFTLIEAALATIIVGTGVLAILSAYQVLLEKNEWSSMTSTATWLGNEIREMSLNLPRHDPVTAAEFWGPEPDEIVLEDYDDVDDFDGNGGGLVFSADLGNGPINAARQIINHMDGWEQIVTVHSVDVFDIVTPLADASTDMVRVEVIVRYTPRGLGAEPMEMTRVSWLAPK